MFKKLLKCFVVIFIISFGTKAVIANASTFANGADIGWVNQLESNGINWVNDY